MCVFLSLLLLLAAYLLVYLLLPLPLFLCESIRYGMSSWYVFVVFTNKHVHTSTHQHTAAAAFTGLLGHVQHVRDETEDYDLSSIRQKTSTRTTQKKMLKIRKFSFITSSTDMLGNLLEMNHVILVTTIFTIRSSNISEIIC